ncbi:hypothetical protein [Bradyrhizobium nanningense]|uniref:hypothetical protein n=1 Tax=Bradyrhizobium nanningense TaxID=1325118 RepID=UPI0013E8F2CD|nr:hypothetical protein [Bradyrhizobium nanningense]
MEADHNQAGECGNFSRAMRLGNDGMPGGGGAFAYDGLGHSSFHIVMAGLVPAIHALPRGKKNVDARDKPGHDDLL